MEMELAYACDHLILNDDLEEAVEQLEVLAEATRLRATRLEHFAARPVVRMVELASAPAPGLGTRFCVADCETPDQAVRRVLRQWWWELHPAATRFELPPCEPTPAGGCRRELREDAILEISPWEAVLPPDP